MQTILSGTVFRPKGYDCSGFGPTIPDKGSELSTKTKIFPDVSRIYKILKDQLNKGETVLV